MNMLNGNGNRIVLRPHLMQLANALKMDADKDPVSRRAKYKTQAATKLTEIANSRAVRELDFYGE